MRAANPSHALALVIVDELHRAGVTDAVLAPGSRSAALALAFEEHEHLRLHVEIDERSAGFLAIGLARATGRPAAVVVTSGSAVANLHPAVVEADTGRVPLLLLTADRPPELRHTGANQTIDQPGIFAHAPRWTVDLGIAEDREDAVAVWRSTTSRAVAEAHGSSGPPGPVHVNVPFREPTVPVADDGRSPVASFSRPLDGRPGMRPWVEVTRAPRRLPADALARLADRVDAAEHGLIVVGQTLASPTAIERLARATGWPVIAEPTSGARTSERVVAAAHFLLDDPEFARHHPPDLVLRIGRTGLSRAVAARLTADVEQILIDADGAWDDPQRAISGLVVADVEATCDALASRVTAGDPAWRQRWLDADQRARRVLAEVLDADDTPSEPRTARDVAAAVPAGTTLVVGSSMPVRDLDLTMTPREGLRVVANRGASGIDGFVSTAVGVALGSDGPTVALCGDLSLLHDAAGFLVRPDAASLDVTFVVVDNDGGGIFSFLPQADVPGFERVFATPHGRDLAELAGFHRLGYTEVVSAGSLPELVREAIGAGGLKLLHVRTDRHRNLALHRRLGAAVSAALGGEAAAGGG